uniref:Secreted protein n=1 Tax=Macaca fascicularis TaxID=9541 RepID=A0A7N9IAV0_MACFA
MASVSPPGKSLGLFSSLLLSPLDLSWGKGTPMAPTASLLSAGFLGGSWGDGVSLLLPRPEYCGAISAHCSLRLPGSSNAPASASQAVETIGAHHTQLTFVFLVETGFHHVGQAAVQWYDHSSW